MVKLKCERVNLSKPINHHHPIFLKTIHIDQSIYGIIQADSLPDERFGGDFTLQNHLHHFWIGMCLHAVAA